MKEDTYRERKQYRWYNLQTLIKILVKIKFLMLVKWSRLLSKLVNLKQKQIYYRFIVQKNDLKFCIDWLHLQ